MNIERVKWSQERFFENFPGGFSHPTMVEIGKKHKLTKMYEMVQEKFCESAFEDVEAVTEAMIKVVCSASVIAVFDKPKFRDGVRLMREEAKFQLVMGLKEMLYGNQEMGFELMKGILAEYGLAKWSIITVIPAYFYPKQEVFIKPTTVKAIIDIYELEGVKYHPTPTWEFYEKYREETLKMASEVDESLSENLMAFNGFLMLSMEEMGIKVWKK